MATRRGALRRRINPSVNWRLRPPPRGREPSGVAGGGGGRERRRIFTNNHCFIEYFMASRPCASVSPCARLRNVTSSSFLSTRHIAHAEKNTDRPRAAFLVCLIASLRGHTLPGCRAPKISRRTYEVTHGGKNSYYFYSDRPQHRVLEQLEKSSQVAAKMGPKKLN